MFKILLIHGPNLNLLGKREPDHYGTMTLENINEKMTHIAAENGVELRIFQSNSEGALIDAIQDAANWASGVVINPGAYGHYSYAMRDALSAVNLSVIETHMSNIHAREEFRHTTVTSSVVLGCITGLGWRSYEYSLRALIGILRDSLTVVTDH